MWLQKSYMRIISVLLLACFLNSLSCYKRVVVPKEHQDEQLHLWKREQTTTGAQKAITVHWGMYEFDLHPFDISNSHLKGQAWSQIPRASKTQQVHIYIDSAAIPSAPMPQSGEEMSIPLSAIEKIEIYDTATGATVIGCLAGTAVVVFLIILLTQKDKEPEPEPSQESCPFVYVFNGKTYEFAGEIYAGAIHPPLERHDCLPLPALRSVEEEYRVKVTNEAREIQHTNLVEMLVIDHPLGSEVLVDKYGVPHTLTDLQSPREAFSLREESVYDHIVEVDNVSYMSDLTDASDEVMDGMILSFDRPQKVESSKLVIRAKNSFWLDWVFGQFYDHFGDSYHEWYERKKKTPGDELRKWSLEQGIPLSVYIERDGGWQLFDYFHIVGPLAAKRDVLSIDLSGLESDVVKIKLEFGFLFWEIDYVAMDFSTDLPVQKSIISMDSAFDQNGQDEAELLRWDDTSYHVQSQIGDQVVMKFPVPKMAKGASRTVFLHSKGHYEVLRNPQGRPDISFLISFMKPGRFVEFSKERFQELYSSIGN